jgi:WD40 repeat protein
VLTFLSGEIIERLRFFWAESIRKSEGKIYVNTWEIVQTKPSTRRLCNTPRMGIMKSKLTSENSIDGQYAIYIAFGNSKDGRYGVQIDFWKSEDRRMESTLTSETSRTCSMESKLIYENSKDGQCGVYSDLWKLQTGNILKTLTTGSMESKLNFHQKVNRNFTFGLCLDSRLESQQLARPMSTGF